jgi:hypothetical protein
MSEEQDMMPSESARVRLNNFRAEMQDIKKSYALKHDNNELLRSRHIYNRPPIIENA